MGRGHIEIIQSSDVEPVDLPASGWPPGALLRTLSRDSDNGAFTGLLALPGGYRRGSGRQAHGADLFVLSGTLRIGETLHAPGFYQHIPAETDHESWTASTDCELILMSAGPGDFTPGTSDRSGADGQINIDTERMPWSRGRHPGPPPGLFSKTLRHDPETGARVFLCSCVRRYDYPMIEYHDCHEEAFHVTGDMRMGTSGLMSPGSYFWRPPYISHGPFYSQDGMIALMTVDGPLVNHYVSDPRRTPEQNRAEAATKPPAHDPHAAPND
jgi:hypothetical protein